MMQKPLNLYQKINAETRIQALKAERDSILAELFGVGQPAYAHAA